MIPLKYVYSGKRVVKCRTSRTSKESEAQYTASRFSGVVSTAGPQPGWSCCKTSHMALYSLQGLIPQCREQRQPPYIAFIDLTKSFDLVSRNILFHIHTFPAAQTPLARACPPHVRRENPQRPAVWATCCGLSSSRLPKAAFS